MNVSSIFSALTTFTKQYNSSYNIWEQGRDGLAVFCSAPYAWAASLDFFMAVDINMQQICFSFPLQRLVCTGGKKIHIAKSLFQVWGWIPQSMRYYNHLLFLFILSQRNVRNNYEYRSLSDRDSSVLQVLCIFDFPISRDQKGCEKEGNPFKL